MFSATTASRVVVACRDNLHDVSPRFTLASSVASLGGAVAALSLSCGPSYQIIYEGDVRFEHCYAVDESTTASMQEKSACWRDWMKRYTYGQTRDRIEYAAGRQSALASAPDNPTDEALMEAAPGGGVRKNVISAPMPSSAFAAPPAIMADEGRPDGGVAPKASAAPPVRAPGAECMDACSKDWGACKEGCAGKGCDACDATYKSCARPCLGDKPPGEAGPPVKPPPGKPVPKKR
jgi:hypothetical protein